MHILSYAGLTFEKPSMAIDNVMRDCDSQMNLCEHWRKSQIWYPG